MSDSPAQHWTDSPGLLWDYANNLERQHTARLNLDKACLRLLYARPDLAASERTTAGRVVGSLTAFESFRRQGYNLSREVVGGALAMTVRPMQIKIMPVGANHEVHAACEKFSRLVDGVIETNRFLETAQRVASDAMACSLGAVKVFVDSKSEIRIERVDPLTLFWDQYEGDRPLCLVQIHAVPRRRLMAEYPQHAAQISRLSTWAPQPIPGVEGQSGGTKPDTVKVVEATSVKVGETNGRHVIAIEGAILEDDPYEDEEHDIVPFRWDNDYRQFGGVSLVRGVAPYHCWTNRLVRTHYEQLKAAVPIIWTHVDETTFKNISDLEYQIGRYDGPTPPKVEIAGTVSQDVVEHIQALRERCFQENGVSFQMATGQKPTGLNSAPAQREWLDTVNLRMQQVQQRWEQLWRDVATRICRKAAVAYKSKAARYRAPGTDFLNEIKWGDINLKENQYAAVASAASGLSLTVSGKIDQLEVLKNLGVIDPNDVGAHLKLPDTEALQSEKNSPQALASKMIFDALHNGEFTSPSPLQDLNVLLKKARLQYQKAMELGIYPTKNMQCLRRLIRACEARLAPPPPPPAPPAPPPLPPAPAPLVNTMAAPVAPAAPPPALPPLAP